MRSTPTPVSGSSARVEAWSGRRFAERVDDAMDIYARAMQYPQHAAAQRSVTARKHVSHEGFACRAAVLDDGTLIGFGYGYTTLPGQWWHDLVRRAVTQDADYWLREAFELSELHVRPETQGQGIGEQLLRSLAEDLPHRTMLLSTPEGDNRAWRLYRRLGFQDLARNHLFPGDHRPFGVLGAALPFPPQAG